MSGLESGGQQPNLVVRGSAGLSLRKPTDYAQNQAFKPDESKTVKTFQFSHDGTKLAWSNLSTVQISVLKNGVWTVSLSLDQPKTSAIAWSPCSTHLATWEMYAIVNGQQPKPNLNIWILIQEKEFEVYFKRNIKAGVQHGPKMNLFAPGW